MPPSESAAAGGGSPSRSNVQASSASNTNKASSDPAGTGSNAKPPEFNPRWNGYVFIGLASLVNFSSISNIPRQDRRSYWAASMAFGLVTFGASLLILLQDRSQRFFIQQLPYSKARAGYLEGGTLGFMVLWWNIGTAYTTRGGGIAFVASNIYFSSWGALFSCVYTLNKWSASKDILTIQELTSLSATLKSWWVLCLSSMVVLGTSIDLYIRLKVIRQETSETSDDVSFGVALGVISMVMSFLYLLIHYDFIFPNNTVLEEGSWMELSVAFFLILLWTIGLAILTQDQGVAATIGGSSCGRSLIPLDHENCTVLLYVEDANGNLVAQYADCSNLPRQVPGSNLYAFSWICFFASLNVALRWKAAQALQFAHAQRKEQAQQQLKGNRPDDTYNDGGSHQSDGEGVDEF